MLDKFMHRYDKPALTDFRFLCVDGFSEFQSLVQSSFCPVENT